MSRSRADLGNAAGINKELVDIAYAYQSGYVHGDGLSGVQIMGAPSRDAQISHIDGQMHLVMIPLANMIVAYAKQFPEAQVACARDEQTWTLARVYAEVGRRYPLAP